MLSFWFWNLYLISIFLLYTSIFTVNHFLDLTAVQLVARIFLSQSALPSLRLLEDLSAEIYPDDIAFTIRTSDLILSPPTYARPFRRFISTTSQSDHGCTTPRSTKLRQPLQNRKDQDSPEQCHANSLPRSLQPRRSFSPALECGPERALSSS